MATRFYLPSASSAVPISPTPHANWTDVSLLVRAATWPYPSLSTMATVTHPADGAGGTKYVLLRQYVTPAFNVGQTVTGGQSLTAQVRASSADSPANNAFIAVGARIMAADGTTVRKSLVSPAIGSAATSATLTNKTLSATTSAGEYVTVAGDHLVIEVGIRVNPNVSNEAAIRLGYTASGWLPVDDTDTTDLSPWVELADSLTFGVDMTSDAGSFTVTGQDAGLLAGRLPLTAEFGEFVVDGQDATLTFGVVIEAEAGSFGVSGQDAELVATRLLDGETGSFTVSGQDADLVHGFAAQAESGAFVLDGHDAEFAVSKGIICDVGEFGVAGQDASLVYSGEHLHKWRSPRESLAWMMIDEAGGTR